VIPVEVTQTPWHYTTFWDWLDHWQTLIAGGLAFAAGFGTVVAAIGAIWVTRSTANKQIDASREEANRVIAATREQTETTVRLEQTRNANEVSAFRVMLEAAMTRVLDEAARARMTYSRFFEEEEENFSYADVLAVRQCITKGAFAELRAACVRQGGPLIAEFLDLEREIDNFALQYPSSHSLIRLGSHAGLGHQLAFIEKKATARRDRAAERI
jgi:hypothetical protein